MRGKVKTIVAVDRSLHWILHLGKQSSDDKKECDEGVLDDDHVDESKYQYWVIV